MQRRGAQVYAVQARRLAQRVALFQHRAGNDVAVLAVVVARPPGQEAGVQGGANHERQPRFPRGGKDVMQGVGVVDQRILPRQKADIHVRDLQRRQDRFRRVHAQAPALDDPFLAHPRQGGKGAVARDLELLFPRCRQGNVVGRQVMHENHVQGVDAHALQTVVNRAPHPVRRIVVGQIVGRRREREVVAGVVARRGPQQLAHLGRQHIVAARLGVQEGAEAAFAQTQPIPGGGVVIAHASLPSGLQRLMRRAIGYNGELIAQRHAAQAKIDGRAIAAD